jgi:predicted branched-subunit amino acid permease
MRTLVLIGVSALLAAAAIVVGIDDNPPGIALGFLSALAFVVAFVHSWNDWHRFRRLVYASVAALIALVVISDLLEAILSEAAVPAIVDSVLNAIAVSAFLLIPAGLVVGVVGALITWRRERMSSGSSAA